MLLIQVRFKSLVRNKIDDEILLNFYSLPGDVVLIEGQSGGSIVGITPGSFDDFDIAK